MKRVLALVADVTAFPAYFEPLPVAERLIVALAMGRVDLLKAEGVDSVVQARDRIGMEWSRAVSAARWKK